MKEKKTVAPMIDTGIAQKDRAKIAAGLSKLLADNYTLYLKTHNFHWNVTGPMFNTLHLMFETQYNELWLANDQIAERIRALGYPGARHATASTRSSSSIKETPGQPKAEEMVRAAGRGQRGGRAHGALDLPGGRQGERRADRGSAHAAHADPREERVDAAQPAGG